MEVGVGPTCQRGLSRELGSCGPEKKIPLALFRLDSLDSLRLVSPGMAHGVSLIKSTLDRPTRLLNMHSPFIKTLATATQMLQPILIYHCEGSKNNPTNFAPGLIRASF